MTEGMRAGQVAAAAGVNLQTLRYYERRGLLQPPGRTLVGIGSTRIRRSRCSESSRPRNGWDSP